MLFYAACFLAGYLIHRWVNGKKAYLLCPVGAFLASLVGLLAMLLIAPLLDLEINSTAAVVAVFWQTFWGSMLVAGTLWFYRRKTAKSTEASKSAEQPK